MDGNVNKEQQAVGTSAASEARSINETAGCSNTKQEEVLPVLVQQPSTRKSNEMDNIARRRFLNRERMRQSMAQLSLEARESLRALRRRQYAERIARETEEEKKLRKEKMALKHKQYLAQETPQQKQRRLDRVRRRAQYRRALLREQRKEVKKANQGAKKIADGSNLTVVSSKPRRKQVTPRKSKEATTIFQFDNLANSNNDSMNSLITSSDSEDCPSLDEIPAFKGIIEREQEDSLLIDNVVLAGEPPSRFSVRTFFTDDEKVEFYTGITSFKKLCSLFDSLALEMGVQDSYEQLPRFEQFCLTLMNLRLNLQPEDFGVLFHLPLFEVSQCINRFISLMFVLLVPTSWPKYVESQIDALMPQILAGKEISKFNYFVHLVKVRFAKELYLNYFVAFSVNGLVSYVSPGYPEPFQQEIEKWELIGFLKHLSHGDKILTKINNQIKIYKCDKKKRLNRTLFNQDISDELNFWTHKILDPFKRRFAVFCHDDPFIPVDSLTPINYKATNSSAMKLKIDQIVKVCCALHNSDPLSLIFKSLISLTFC